MIMKKLPIVSLPSQCDLCDASYVGYTLRHLHQRVVEHKNMSSSISKHYKDKHSTVKKILKKCNNKFDCLVHEMLLISKQNFLRDFAYFIYGTNHQQKNFLSVYQQSIWTWKWRQDDTETSFVLTRVIFYVFLYNLTFAY